MYFERLRNINDAMCEKVIPLYRISFPFHEQREYESQIEIMGNNDYHFDLIYDHGVWVGLILYWEAKSFIYVEHFCILPEMRCKHYGQRALELLKEKNKMIILEIDPPVDDLSISR